MDNQPQEFVLYLEDLDDFVSNIIADGSYGYPQGEGHHQKLRDHWISYFDGETALILDDESYDSIMVDYDKKGLNDALLEGVRDGIWDLYWDEDKSDFTFRLPE